MDPTLPTDAPAGSEAKILVMQARAALGLPLFHPHDSRLREDDHPAGGHPPRGEGALPPGVTWDEKRRGYRARTPRPERTHLGLFDSAEDAAAALELARTDLQAAKRLARKHRR